MDNKSTTIAETIRICRLVLQIILLHRCVAWLTTLFYNSNCFSRALMVKRPPPERVQLHSFTPVPRARQLNARTIAGSLHKSISSAQPSQAVGGHIWEQRVFNVLTTGDGLCSPQWRLRRFTWLTSTTSTLSKCFTDLICRSTCTDFFFFFSKKLWLGFSWAGGATGRFYMAADVEMNHKSEQNHAKISGILDIWLNWRFSFTALITTTNTTSNTNTTCPICTSNKMTSPYQPEITRTFLEALH